jgi:predicted tellurium resistance membrane protein TerC
MFGLALSIPFVVFTSNLLSMLMDRYPIIIYIGAAVLGRVGAEMIFTDPWVVSWLAPPDWFRYTMEAVFAGGVIVVGKLWLRFVWRKAEAEELATNPEPDARDQAPAPRSEEG